jgi:lipopolysaccharide/colanic/teichoic acid biosynthesis glycosyltransferase
VLFKQERVGFRKKPFVCLKFRTMKIEADTVVHKQYLCDLIKDENKTMVKLDEKDPRIIPFGKILRKTGLDELPQLINILLGDMSIVGPRPCTSYELSEYRTWHQRRFDTKPGLTGLWQVNGKNKTTFVEMMRLDIGYSISKSLLKDLWILIKTFPAVCAQVFDRFPKEERRSHEKSD